MTPGETEVVAIACCDHSFQLTAMLGLGDGTYQLGRCSQRRILLAHSTSGAEATEVLGPMSHRNTTQEVPRKPSSLKQKLDV